MFASRLLHPLAFDFVFAKGCLAPLMILLHRPRASSILFCRAGSKEFKPVVYGGRERTLHFSEAVRSFFEISNQTIIAANSVLLTHFKALNHVLTWS
jgi:hypothetical protein